MALWAVTIDRGAKQRHCGPFSQLWQASLPLAPPGLRFLLLVPLACSDFSTLLLLFTESGLGAADFFLFPLAMGATLATQTSNISCSASPAAM